MCRSVAVLRLVAFLLLLIAFVACCIGFVAPFWVQTVPPQGSTPPPPPTTTPGGTLLPYSPSSSSSSSPPPSSSSLNPPSIDEAPRPRNQSEVRAPFKADELWNGEEDEEEEEEEEQQERVKRETGNGTTVSGDEEEEEDQKYEGLWATCNRRFKCRCFAQNNFELEKEYPIWHKAAQGLFTAGLAILLITLLIGGFYLCCRCCRESVALATVLGTFSLVAFLPIVLSVAVFGGFSYGTRNVQLTTGGDGVNNKFLWGYFVSVAGALTLPLAALLYCVEGRRKVIVEHDDCETARMV